MVGLIRTEGDNQVDESSDLFSSEDVEDGVVITGVNKNAIPEIGEYAFRICYALTSVALRRVISFAHKKTSLLRIFLAFAALPIYNVEDCSPLSPHGGARKRKR